MTVHVKRDPSLSRSTAGEIAVDHPVHVEEVALLAAVEPEGWSASGLHPDLDVFHVGVVLVGDLTPVALGPVWEEAAFGSLEGLVV